MNEFNTEILSECENKETESEEECYCRLINDEDGTEEIITIDELVEMMSEKTKEGDAAAAYILSDLYLKGRGVSEDIRKAYELMKWSADKGYADAQYNMAGAYLVGDNYNLQQNIEKGISYLKLAAEQRDSYAMRMLGKYHLTGDYGIQKSNKKAFYYLSEAAKGDNMNALFEVSDLYYFGVGTRKSIKKAIECCKAAADKGHPEAQYSMWLHFCDDEAKISYEEAYGYLMSAARTGLKEANNYLGKIFYADECFDEAFHYFEFAADKGCIDAMFRLGECYFYGEGTEKNLEKAFELYIKAAEYHHDAATYCVALCYDYGYGTQKNKKLAFEWYKKAARLGHVYAINNLGVCYVRGEGVDKNVKKAIACYSVASREGDANSSNSLGRIYEIGYGVEKDISKAIEFYEKAASLGDSSGAFNLARCYQFGMGVDKDVSKAVDWYIESSPEEKERVKEMFLSTNIATLSGADAYKVATFLLEFNDDICKSKALDLLIYSAENSFTDARKYIAKLFLESDEAVKSETLATLFWPESAQENDITVVSAIGKGEDITNNSDYLEDDEQKRKLYEITAKGGDAVAIFNEAFTLEKINPQKAFELYKKSAALGEPYGIYAVAKCYEDGTGTEKDEKMYFKYLKKAVKSGAIPEAITDLGSCYGKGKVTDKNNKKAMRLYLKAALLGDMLALTNIAWFYETGTGVKKNTDIAYHLYKTAAEAGEKHAIERLTDWEQDVV